MQSTQSLEGKVAPTTGASKGLGIVGNNRDTGEILVGGNNCMSNDVELRSLELEMGDLRF